MGNKGVFFNGCSVSAHFEATLSKKALEAIAIPQYPSKHVSGRESVDKIRQEHTHRQPFNPKSVHMVAHSSSFFLSRIHVNFSYYDTGKNKIKLCTKP